MYCCTTEQVVSVLLLSCYHDLLTECDINIQSHINSIWNNNGFLIRAGHSGHLDTMQITSPLFPPASWALSSGAPGHTPLGSAQGLYAQLSPRQAKGCSRFSRENHNSGNNYNSSTAWKRHKMHIFHGKYCQRRKTLVPQEYFIWPHKILVHGQ